MKAERIYTDNSGPMTDYTVLAGINDDRTWLWIRVLDPSGEVLIDNETTLTNPDTGAVLAVYLNPFDIS